MLIAPFHLSNRRRLVGLAFVLVHVPQVAIEAKDFHIEHMVGDVAKLMETGDDFLRAAQH